MSMEPRYKFSYTGKLDYLRYSVWDYCVQNGPGLVCDCYHPDDAIRITDSLNYYHRMESTEIPTISECDKCGDAIHLNSNEKVCIECGGENLQIK